MKPDAPHHLFVGDESAEPAIDVMTEAIPPTATATAVLGTEAEVVDRLRSVALPAGTVAYVFGESGLVRARRRGARHARTRQGGDRARRCTGDAIGQTRATVSPVGTRRTVGGCSGGHAERKLRQLQLIEWWRARAALNERLAVLTDELSAESPPADFLDAIDEIRRLEPLFQDAPDAELDRLNRMRRDLLVTRVQPRCGRPPRPAAELLDQLTVVTDAAVARIEHLLEES